MPNFPQPSLPANLSMVRYPAKGTYSSYRIAYEENMDRPWSFRIVGVYRNRQQAGERRIAGGFKTAEDAERYISRFLPEFLECS